MPMSKSSHHSSSIRHDPAEAVFNALRFRYHLNMIRATTFAGFFAAYALCSPLSAQAEDPTGLEQYLQAVATAEASIDESCAVLRESTLPEGRVWLRRGANGLEIVPQDARAAEAAAFWAKVALGAEEAARILYGRAVEDRFDAEPVMIETSGGIATIHDGSQMTEGDGCDALRSMIGGPSGSSSGANPFDAARDAARDETRVALAIGGTALAPITADLPDNAQARGPDGVLTSIQTGDDGSIVEVSAQSDARPGASEIRLYDPADPFTPIETIPLSVLPGPAAQPSSVSEEAFTGDIHEGVLPLGEAQRLVLDLKEGERVILKSAAGADLKASLESDDGRIITADDDSGIGYGFSLEADLPPGRYVLNLSHCCGGGGAFTVTRSK